MSETRDKRIVGNCRKKQIEIRYDDAAHTVLDEIVAFNACVHLEMMSDQSFALIIETPTERGCYWIASKNGKSHVRAMESWRESINRRKEAATRRENGKKWAREKRAGRRTGDA